MVTNCVRLSNNPSYFSSSDGVNMNNSYSKILKSDKTIRNNNVYSNSKTMGSIVIFMKPEVVKNIKRLRDIESLTFDWNGYGAKPFSGVLIDKCERIVGMLSVQPSIYPTGRNSIQFQYELNDKSYLEFEIFENKTMCLQVPKRVYADAIELELTNLEDNRIKEIVDNFYGRNNTEK